jgi:hypothetical protein
LAVAGLDRFVRVHSMETRAGLGKVYCKQQLTGVVWLRPPPSSSGGGRAAQEEEEENGRLPDAAGQEGQEEGRGRQQQAAGQVKGGAKQGGKSKSKKLKTGQ